MTTYVFLYSSRFTRDQVKRFLNSRADVLHWMTCLPNSFFVVSSASAQELSEAFREFTEDRGMFLILDARGARVGRLPEEGWELIEKPEQAVRQVTGHASGEDH